MKKLIIFSLTIILLSLAACSGTGVSGGTTSFESTLTALESENANQVTALQAEIASLKAELSDTQNQQQSLKDERDAAVEKADKYYSMFIVENADDEGDYIFCEQAFETSFGYADKVSMRMELIKYLAKLRGYNPEAMSLRAPDHLEQCGRHHRQSEWRRIYVSIPGALWGRRTRPT